LRQFEVASSTTSQMQSIRKLSQIKPID